MSDQIRFHTIPPTEPRRTFGEILPDGTHLELVRKNPQAIPEILLWDGRTATTGTTVEHSGQIYQAGPIAPTLFRSLHLPTHAGPYGSAKDLFGNICNSFLAHCNLSNSSSALLSAFAISTSFAEFLPVAPCISIAAPTLTEAIILLRLLGCFCYHPLRLGALSKNGMLHLPTQLRPTLLINASGVSKGAHVMLNASTHRGLTFQKSDQLVEVYCAKAIAGIQHATFLDNAIQITIDPPRSGSTFDDRAEAELALEFQPQLLKYRLENRERVLSSRFDVPEFTTPMREIARNLGRCLVDNELQQSLSALLCDRDQELRGNRSLDFPATVVEALFAFCHENGTRSVHVKEITLAARTILEARGEDADLSFERTGLILRNLGLHTVKLDRNGKGLELRDGTNRRIHQLAAQYGIGTSAPKGATTCECCSTPSSSQSLYRIDRAQSPRSQERWATRR